MCYKYDGTGGWGAARLEGAKDTRHRRKTDKSRENAPSFAHETPVLHANDGKSTHCDSQTAAKKLDGNVSHATN